MPEEWWGNLSFRLARRQLNLRVYSQACYCTEQALFSAPPPVDVVRAMRFSDPALPDVPRTAANVDVNRPSSSVRWQSCWRFSLTLNSFLPNETGADHSAWLGSCLNKRGPKWRPSAAPSSGSHSPSLATEQQHHHHPLALSAHQSL